ncbi:hypothetical protein [Patiriisocius hiemis]|uniref:Uncharacterized protein n=1 Tax=Patiriisocius hiemis TaxID=3075604 RepID=A0ABU2YCT1_9FLAO|nr:hypothetical protein [Constantimarinum sp. W242]MDT0555615.1 hypothetical protein [Constantimarinum sp. W242]
MKTRHLWAFLALSITFQVVAQNQKNKYSEAGKALQKNFLEMLQDASVLAAGKEKDTTPCEPFLILQQFTKSDLLPNTKPFEAYFKNVLEDYNKKLNALQDNIILTTSSNPNESYFAAISRSRRFKDFAEDITGIKILDINKKDKDILLDFYVNHPLKKRKTITTKGEKIASAKFAECYATTNHTLKANKWKYPKVTWFIKTTVTITCDCANDSNRDEVNEAIFEYDAFVNGTLTTSNIDFEKTKGSSFSLEKVSCCPGEEDPNEDTSIDLPEDMLVSLPEQTLGVSGGIGFEQDLEEVSICLGAEYLFNITELGNSPLYIGGVAKLATASFMDFNSTTISVGPTAQLFTPISTNGDTQMTNGLTAVYLFGTNDNNGFKDDISGYQIGLNTGLNVQISSNASISLIIPIVSFQNLTFESQEGGGSLDVSNTSILLNKNNPVTLGVRIGL